LALSKLLLRSRGGIQYVEHSEGHGEKLFEAVCDLGLEGIVSKRLTIGLSLGSVENLDQSQKSEGSRRHSRYRWDILTPVSLLAARLSLCRAP